MLRSFLITLSFATLACPQPPIQITIHAEASGKPIPSTVFGTFLEPIGNSTYNGLWAELLQNPSFESGLWSAPKMRDLITADPQLTRSSQLALPLPWEPLYPDEGNRYEPRRDDAANSYQSLAVFGLPDRETGIRQEIYLPVHRELAYRGSLFLKHLSGSEVVRISLRKRNAPDRTLVSTEVHASVGDWQKYQFELSLTPGQLKALEPADFVITVDGDERTIMDQVNLFPADALGGLDPDMVRMAREMRTPLVRFGGNFTSSYHWRDGIGPADKRISMRNVAWGIPETNQFGTDEFLHFCELIGAQPQIALNLGSGTSKEAANWVRYADEHWSAHSGLLWELGNELWGDWNNGYPTLGELAQRTLQFSRAIKEIDPRARLIATGQDPDHYHDWNAMELKDPAGTFDLLSTHFVVDTDRLAGTDHSPETIARDTFALPVALERKLHEMQKQIDDAGQPKTHIAFTEWLFHSSPGNGEDAPSFDNFGGAIAAAGFLNMILRNADIVPVSDMTGIIEFAGIWKKRSQVFGTPAYYAFRMFSTADPTMALDVDNDSPTYNVRGGVSRLPDIPDVPYLDAVAVRTAKGISLFCVNRDINRDLNGEIALDGVNSDGRVDIQELFATSLYTANDEVHPYTVTPKLSSIVMTGSKLQFVFRHASITRIDFELK
ncbi:MAG TPA: alpha-L-arabinofuranosidase C-terminal domain-containing protein [Bryobacteraceae bacterium]|jgi:alpha-N-arabinofuranosidase|nr:alpha-L-arabinofuranosidase C-terminal domain-containing protein [Bryobacteraceae bacterium]